MNIKRAMALGLIAYTCLTMTSCYRASTVIGKDAITEVSEKIVEEKTIIDEVEVVSYEDCIFRYSSETLLTDKDILGYDKVILRIGVNEIYARHGYSFNNKEWKTYFNNKPWYKINDDFTIENFNDIEKQNIKFLGESDTILCKDIMNVDMNSDGVDESIDMSHEGITSMTDFSYLDMNYYESYYGSLITDIDINDGVYEVMVFDGGPSGDDTIGIYRYNRTDNNLQHIDFSSARHYTYEIKGNGTYKLEGMRHDIYVINTYILNDNGYPQYVDTIFPVFSMRKSIGSISKGERIQVLGFEYKYNEKYVGIEGIDQGPNGLLGIKIAPINDMNKVEIIDLDSYNTIVGSNEDTREIVPFNVLLEYFEISEMYYGD